MSWIYKIIHSDIYQFKQNVCVIGGKPLKVHCFKVIPSLYCHVCKAWQWGVGASSSWCVVVEGLDVRQLSTPSAPSCSYPCAVVHTWSMTALHTGIFHFLFSVVLLHSSPPLCSFPQIKSKTSGALQLGGWRQWHPHQPVRQQHAWHFKPNPMTQLLWRELRIASLLVLKLVPNVWG